MKILSDKKYYELTLNKLLNGLLEIENEKLHSIIKESLDKLTIKQSRFINEKDYLLDDNDLDEIMKILEKGV